MEGDLSAAHSVSRSSQSNGHSSAGSGEGIPNGANLRLGAVSTVSPEQRKASDVGKGEDKVKVSINLHLVHSYYKKYYGSRAMHRERTFSI